MVKDQILGLSYRCHKHRNTSLCSSQNCGFTIKMSPVELKELHFNEPVGPSCSFRLLSRQPWERETMFLMKNWPLSLSFCPDFLLSILHTLFSYTLFFFNYLILFLFTISPSSPSFPFSSSLTSFCCLLSQSSERVKSPLGSQQSLATGPSSPPTLALGFPLTTK